MPDFIRSSRFLAAVRAFEEANSRDPNREIEEGVEHPREVLYARRLTAWVLALNPQASEPLQLAARCQHLGRWEIPRQSYPPDRAGYLRWRRDLQQFHARRSGEILAEVGYDAGIVHRVQALNLKQNLAGDPDVQTLEDALCLVFLQFQLADLARKTEPDKLVNALRKSWGKMSPAGRDAAGKLNLGEVERRLVALALADPPPPPPPSRTNPP